ncbi:MAG: rhomboid family intramembrane serine protease [Anaerolineae bacterium]|nr:MAG: rhomboid family intramembrane serine protease [Anaerolineae bacterium]
MTVSSETPEPKFPPGVPPASPSADSTAPRVIRVRLPAAPPYVVYAIMALTVLVYLLQMLSQFLFGVDLPVAYGVKYGQFIAEGQVWRLLTPLFLHGGIWHIGFNMYALYVLGPSLERFLGHVRFLLLYLLAGFGGNLLSLYLTPEPSLGASTAIFGLIAAQAILVYQNRFLFPNPNQAIGSMMRLAILNFLIGLSPGIDNWGHLGGFLGGGAYAWFASPVFKVVPTPFGEVLQDVRDERTWWGAAAWIGAVMALLTAVWMVL